MATAAENALRHLYWKAASFQLEWIRVALPFLVLSLLAFLVIVPLFFTVLASFRPAELLPLEPGPFTFSAYTEAFTGADFLPIIINTVLYATLGVLFAFPLAFGFAFLTERTDMPFRNLVYVLMFVPMSTPVFATALGWVLLLGPRAGVLNQYWRLLTGSDATDGPFNVFSLSGLIFVHVLGVVPVMWLFLTSVLRTMDASLEDAAAASGASRWETLTGITVPLLRPGVAAVLVYFFLQGLESLELPLALGPTAGIELLSTKIFFTLLSTADAGVNFGIPAAFGMLGLATGTLGILFYLYLVRQASRYAVVTGKGYRPRLVRLGNWKYGALAVLGLYVFIKIILPFGVLIYSSLLRYYIPPVPESLESLKFTLFNYSQLLDYRFFGRYFINTLIVSFGSATATMFLVSLISWMVVRYPCRITYLVNVVAFMPLAIPGVISSLAFFLMFLGTPLFGTLFLLTIAFLARYLAFGTRLMHSAMLQIHQELEEASLASGAGHLWTFLSITVRLLLPAFLNGWLWVLTHAAKDFSVALMLASASSLLAANMIYSMFTAGDYPRAAAMMVFLVLFNMVAVIIGRRWIIKAVSPAD